MRVQVFHSVLERFRRALHRGRLHALHSRQEIDAMLERERARADRNGHEFSLVLFTPVQPVGTAKAPPAAALLAKLLLQRSRATDHIGWFDESTLCALLPDTTADGARSFTQSVSELLLEQSPPASASRPGCTVYTYPSNWSLDRDDSDSSGHPQRRDRRRPASSPLLTPADEALPQASRGALYLGVNRFAADSSEVAWAPHDVNERSYPVRPLEGLLARPLPAWKRGLDIFGALCGLTIAAPVMLIAASAIKLTSPGPIFYKQIRSGLGGKPFGIWKFRTMVVNADAVKAELMRLNEQDGPAFKLKNDPRVTRIGRFLRKTSIDELPQLINVLLGDMSLVGPRPLPVGEQNAGEQWHQRRLDVTPGLTCIWQVRGRSKVTFNEWVRMDMTYIRRRTFLHDLKILAQTVPAVVLRRGAS